jgi:hypothetical protein
MDESQITSADAAEGAMLVNDWQEQKEQPKMT